MLYLSLTLSQITHSIITTQSGRCSGTCHSSHVNKGLKVSLQGMFVQCFRYVSDKGGPSLWASVTALTIWPQFSLFCSGLVGSFGGTLSSRRRSGLTFPCFHLQLLCPRLFPFPGHYSSWACPRLCPGRHLPPPRQWKGWNTKIAGTRTVGCVSVVNISTGETQDTPSLIYELKSVRNFIRTWLLLFSRCDPGLGCHNTHEHSLHSCKLLSVICALSTPAYQTVMKAFSDFGNTSTCKTLTPHFILFVCLFKLGSGIKMSIGNKAAISQ